MAEWLLGAKLKTGVVFEYLFHLSNRSADGGVAGKKSIRASLKII
jgi:hypothetical protein